MVAPRVKKWLNQRESRENSGSLVNSDYNDIPENAPAPDDLPDNTPVTVTPGKAAAENEDRSPIVQGTPAALEKGTNNDDLQNFRSMDDRQ